MKAHELAKALLKGKNLPVVINGWGSSEGTEYEVTAINNPENGSFQGSGDTSTKPKRDRLGYQKDRLRISLDHGNAVYAKETKEKISRRIVKSGNDTGGCSLTRACFTDVFPASFLGKLAK